MKKFLKGQMHVHTTCSDGENTPQEMLDAYQLAGYDFIVWTDHIKNIDIDKYISDKKGVICIGGIELDTEIRSNKDVIKSDFEPYNEFGQETFIHTNGIGVYNTNMSFEVVKDNVPKTIENMFDCIVANGGIPMLNHPNWLRGASFRELLQVNRDFLMEIGKSYGFDYQGTFAKESMETIWDILLTNGKKVFATSTDDAHTINPIYEDRVWDYYNRGYVGVWAEKDEDSILEALKNGNFYASNGVDLEEYSVNDKSMTVKVKPENDEKYIIMFKGRMGIPLKIVYGTEGTYEFTNSYDESYVRAKIISNHLKENTSYAVERGSYHKACYCQPYFSK